MLLEQKQFIKATLTTRIDTDVIVSPPYVKCVVRAETVHKSDVDEPY